MTPNDSQCYDPPQFFSSLLDPLLVTLPMPKRPLPLNLSPLPDLPPLPPSEPSKPSSPLDQPPVEPLVPVPWNIHHQEYSSMEMYQEPPPVENPLEDPDSPMEDAPPLEPEPFIPYEPNVPEGNTHALSPEESPASAKVQKVGKGLPRQRWPLPRQSYDYTGRGSTYTRAYKASTTLPPFETFADVSYHGKSTLPRIVLCPTNTPCHLQVLLQRPYANAPVEKAVTTQSRLLPCRP